jgi:hypothetical protein
VEVEIRRRVACKLLEDEDTGVAARFLLVLLEELDSGRDLHDHEVVAERGTAVLRDLAEGFRRCEHDVNVGVREEGFDIVVEAEEVAVALEDFAALVQEVVYPTCL